MYMAFMADICCVVLLLTFAPFKKSLLKSKWPTCYSEANIQSSPAAWQMYAATKVTMPLWITAHKSL